MLSVFGLEGCTDRVRRRGCAGRTYVDVLRSAIAFSVVISAVLNRAIDALDVLFALAIIVHNNLYSVLNFKIQIPTSYIF